ncbi:MAG: S8 family serine peptidase [Bacteroidales bacterium]|nr:S8 family serine peptidase [Candidatus Colimorpha onthohippi]
MYRILIYLFVCIVVGAACMPLHAQTAPLYWVLLTDKKGVTFDPFQYFDSKAITRYQQCGADLYDTSNLPLRTDYIQQTTQIAPDTLGCSRWLNAIALHANNQQIEQLNELSCVKEVVPITNVPMRIALRQHSPQHTSDTDSLDDRLSNQLIRMHGELFSSKHIDGTGVRIAVLDGGFPRVNTHHAFQHLRDKNRIIATWNFPCHKADVYGWDSHGTSVLSCITGIAPNGKMMGLATNSEFLLARTEVALEPAQEEVWWQLGTEWADKYGADIISSSLGYGKDRYHPDDMNGTSLVAHAANQAAGKGILVCCSAGNEGDDASWRTIVTPSDADSALCVAGIEANLQYYQHINFSSYGLTTGQHPKPNVSAYGYALCADAQSDESINYYYGTSFACPLVAGFAACVKQIRPDLTGVQLLSAIEQSADRYPQHDCAIGYGVPQAYYFTGDTVTHSVASTYTPIDDDYIAQLRQTAKHDNCGIFRTDLFWQTGSMVNSSTDEASLKGYSPDNRIGIRLMRALCKTYCLGIGIDYGMSNYQLLSHHLYPFDIALGITDENIVHKYLYQGELALEFFQRIRLVAGGMLTHRGIYCDLGIYGSWDHFRYHITTSATEIYTTCKRIYSQPKIGHAFAWNWGIALRIGYDAVAVFARYRLTNMPTATEASEHILPRMELGLQVAI